MPCLIVAIALLVPRLTMFFIWLLTNWFALAFGSWLWPVLGFVFLPYASLAYMAAMLNNDHNVSGWWLALVILGVLTDLGHFGGGRRVWVRRRRATPEG